MDMPTPGAAGPKSLAVQAEQRRALGPVGAEGDYPGYGSGTSQELSLGLLWRVMVEWRWLIAAALGAGIAGAVLVTLLTPLKYRSVATLELNPPQVEVLGAKAGGEQRAFGSGDMNFIGTQLGLLQSRVMAERVVQDLNLGANPLIVGKSGNLSAQTQAAIGYVQGGLSVKLDPQSRLVRLSFVSRDPALAARIVNGAADAYINTTLERRYQSSSYARTFLQKQIATTRRELENSERQLVAYAQSQHLISTASEDKSSDTSSLTGEALVALNTQLAAAQARRFAAEGKYHEAIAAGPTTETSANVGTIRAQIGGLEAQYQQKLKVFRPDYPDMVQLRAQIDALRASIKTEVRQTSAERAGSLRAEYLAAAAEENKLRGRVGQLTNSVLDLRGRRIRYTILQRDVDTNRTLYDALLQRYKEVGVAGGIGNANASIVDRGTAPGGAFSPNLYLNLLVGAALGLLGGMLAALGLEFLNDTIKTPEDVRNKLHMAFLGGIPASKNAVPVEDLKDPLSGVAEAYFSTATALQFIAEGGAPKTMLVTSTRPAEGKSTSALAIAQSHTRLGKTVLLIDADLRRPAFVTGLNAEIGLSHVITNTSSLSDHVLRTDIDRLWIMPSGPIPPSPPELLASPRFAWLLAEAAATFDLVVIDGPPILGLADSPLLSAAAHATLLVVESGRTRTRAAIEGQNRLRAAGAHVIGAILTRYQPQTAYGYGYGYGYGKAQGQYRYVAEDQDRSRRIALTVSREDA